MSDNVNCRIASNLVQNRTTEKASEKVTMFFATSTDFSGERALWEGDVFTILLKSAKRYIS